MQLMKSIVPLIWSMPGPGSPVSTTRGPSSVCSTSEVQLTVGPAWRTMKKRRRFNIYFAIATERVSLMTVIFTCPG